MRRIARPRLHWPSERVEASARPPCQSTTMSEISIGFPFGSTRSHHEEVLLTYVARETCPIEELRRHCHEFSLLWMELICMFYLERQQQTAKRSAPDVLLVARALPSVHSASALTSCIYQQVTVHVSNVSMISQPRIAWRSKLAHEAPSGHVGHERAFSLTGLIKTQRGLRVSRG